MYSELESKVKEIVISNLGDKYDLSGMGLNDRFDIFGINSINFIRIVVSIETEFGFEFEDEYLNAEKITNLRELVDYIQLRSMK